LYVPHAIQWCELPVPTVSAFCETESVDAGEQTRFSGRYLDSELCPPALFGKWLDLCRHAHSDFCQNPSWLNKLDRPEHLRVIDVQKLAVVSISQGSSYVALSYV
jgi:hypothetical protein